MIMKPLAGIIFLLLQIISNNFIFAQQKEGDFDKSSFYRAMRGNKEDGVNKQLALVKTAVFAEKMAYEGALLMKKAGIVSGLKKKLDLFKAGHNELEAVLQKDSTNIEFRFLRFMIQEHAPGMLGYKGQLEKDRIYIKNNYKKLPAAVQEAVVDYSKESKILKPADL
jgi:hypothetical protein